MIRLNNTKKIWNNHMTGTSLWSLTEHLRLGSSHYMIDSDFFKGKHRPAFWGRNSVLPKWQTCGSPFMDYDRMIPGLPISIIQSGFWTHVRLQQSLGQILELSIVQESPKWAGWCCSSNLATWKTFLTKRAYMLWTSCKVGPELLECEQVRKLIFPAICGAIQRIFAKL